MTEPAGSAAQSQVVIEELSADDLGELLTLQRAAYLVEARRYEDWDLPPLVETIEALQARWRSDLVLKAVAGSRIVGSVRVHIQAEVGHLARLMVAPDMQGRGIGTRLLLAAEQRMPSRVEWIELFTGESSVRNRELYERLGYHELRREPASNGARSIYLRKQLRR